MTLPAETEVLIAGGGPVGLALATELARHGVRSMVVERTAEPSPQPGAKLVNIRSMELLRRWGLADTLRAAVPLGPDWPLEIAYVTRLTGHPLARLPLAGAAGDEPGSAEGPLICSQRVLETVLRQHLSGLPGLCRVVSGAELRSLRGDGSGVTATVRHDGRDRRVRADWLAGCDGAGSVVRRQLGVRMSGRARFADNLAVVFDADLGPLLGAVGRAVQYWTVNPDAPGIIGPVDGRRRWWLHVNATQRPDWTHADVVGHLHRAIGRPVDCSVVDIAHWASHELLADRYRMGRVLLLGDAGHLHPPMGGYGMNAGLGDALDVGWKLAAILRGSAPEALADSYPAERRPVHRLVIDEAVRNYGTLAGGLWQDGAEHPGGAAIRRRMGAAITLAKRREFATAGLQLGYHYAGSPLVVPDGTPEPEFTVGTYQPTARPGHLLPHVPLADGRSLHDVLGPGFTLLVTDSGAPTHPLTAAAAAAGLPLHVVTVGDGNRAALGATLVLVRPDQHVAWRGEHPTAEVIDTARGAACSQCTP